MGKDVRSRGWRVLAVAVALLLGLGMLPGLISTTSVSAQADELSQRDFDDLVEEAQSEDPVYGPEEGELEHDPERVTFEYAGVELSDFLATATFQNPYAASSGQFDYGIQFRGHDENGTARFLRFILISDGTWGITDGTEDVLISDVYDDIDDSRRGENAMTIYAEGDVVHLAINGDYVGSVEVSFDDPGDIAVGTSFLADSFQEDEVTEFTDFTIWEIGGGGRRDDDEPTPDDNGRDDIEGTEYESPTYGYSVIYDDTWEVTNEESEDDVDVLEISNGPSSLQFLAEPTRDTPGECIEAIVDDLSSDDAVENVEIALDENDEEMAGEDDEQAFVVLFVSYATEDGSIDFTAFYQCILIEDGDAMLQITHLALAEDYNDEIENRIAVLDTLDLGGGGGVEPEPTETGLAEGEIVFLLEPVANETDLIFGSLIPDGDQTTVEMLALTEEIGDYEVTIHEGSCRRPGDPVFEVGTIDETGLLDATVDATVEELSNGDYVMIVSEGGDFEDAVIACGVLEEIPEE